MSYIITATIPLSEAMNRHDGVDVLLSDPLIRLLRRDEENETVTLDMRGDFDVNDQQVRWLCERLVNAGIVKFQIGHSY